MKDSVHSMGQLSLMEIDKEMFDVINAEEQRQSTKLEMIASENFTSRAVLEATGSVLTNKYAEGFPGARYYGGCEIVDKAEILAIDRAKHLFDAVYANVQPHCGSSANLIVLHAFLNPGDSIVGMDLSHGGHLSHGSKVSMTGKIYHAAFYGVAKDTELIDFNEVETIVKQHRPKILIAGASAYPRTIDFQRFAQIAQEHGALLLVDMAHIAGLIAAGIHPSPVPYADFVTSTTHKTLRGPRGGMIVMGKDPEFTAESSKASRKPRKYSQILNAATMPGLQGGPLMHVIAAKAVAFKECMSPEFREYQLQVVKNARALAQIFRDNHVRMVSDGTDNHLVLVDVRSSFNITGKEAEIWLDEANISVNKNAIPFDTESVFKTSGIRFGLPAITSRGITEKDIGLIAEYIIDILKSKGNANTINMIGKKVKELTSQFPIRAFK